MVVGAIISTIVSTVGVDGRAVGAVANKWCSRRPVAPDRAAAHPADGVVLVEKALRLVDSDLVDAFPLIKGLVARVAANDRGFIEQAACCVEKPEPTHGVADRAVQLEEPPIIVVFAQIEPIRIGPERLYGTRTVGRA